MDCGRKGYCLKVVKNFFRYSEQDRVKINDLLTKSIEKVDIMAMFQKSLEKAPPMLHHPQQQQISNGPMFPKRIQSLQNVVKMIINHVSLNY